MVVTGTPGIEGLLLRSGRISEEAWSTVRACDTTHEHLATELVDRGLVGTGELEVISLSALPRRTRLRSLPRRRPGRTSAPAYRPHG
ncbi:hypothetical protein AB0I69_24765 [Streptomyces sp. NPDC050508]|uniref:hypothetical protein n=1 Tax=Streptomyces sp. NPDC050508 TaxID=3155405 RepID=UPI003414A6E3